MNIAIIEKGHFEVTYTLILLFDSPNNQITIFIDRESYNQLISLLKEKAILYKWIIQEKKESNPTFIKKLFSYIGRNNFSLLYFNTIADNFIMYSWGIQKLHQKKVILTLHEINGFFHYFPSGSIRKNIRFIGRKKLIKTIHLFNVLSETLIPLLHRELQNEKPIFNIPGALFDPETFNAKEYTAGETIKIVIPGSIDNRRRNYDLVFEFIEKLKPDNLNVTVTLLGSFRKKHSEFILEKCKQYILSGSNLCIYETDIVNQPEFDRVIREAHFIWMPLNQYASVTDGAKEEYGISLSTGNSGDVIRHAKPFFAPYYLSLDSALQKSCCRYTIATDIITRLKNLTPEEYSHLQQEALGASMNYTKEKIIEKNKPVFEGNF